MKILKTYKQLFETVMSYNYLIMMIQKNNLEELKKLIDSGSNVTETNDYGRNLLFYIPEKKFNSKTKEIIKLLIDNGLDINNQTNAGDTALLYYIKSYNVRNKLIIKELIKNGANWNIKNNQGLDFVDILKAKEDTFSDLKLSQIFIVGFQKEYKKYLREKQTKKFKI